MSHCQYLTLIFVLFLNCQDPGVVHGRVFLSKDESQPREMLSSSKTKYLFHHHRLRRSPGVLNCSTYIDNSNASISDNRTKIHIGLLLPFVLSSHGSEYRGGGAKYYSEAFSLAVKRINNDPTLLPGHKLDFVFNDTRCNELDNIKAMYYQYKSRDVRNMPVHGFIGLGCQCNAPAKFASALKVPVVSHVSHLNQINPMPALISLKEINHFISCVVKFILGLVTYRCSYPFKIECSYSLNPDL